MSELFYEPKICEKMQEIGVETILQRAREKYPDAMPRIITDNGAQFISRDFKEFIRIVGAFLPFGIGENAINPSTGIDQIPNRPFPLHYLE